MTDPAPRHLPSQKGPGRRSRDQAGHRSEIPRAREVSQGHLGQSGSPRIGRFERRPPIPQRVRKRLPIRNYVVGEEDDLALLLVPAALKRVISVG